MAFQETPELRRLEYTNIVTCRNYSAKVEQDHTGVGLDFKDKIVFPKVKQKPLGLAVKRANARGEC